MCLIALMGTNDIHSTWTPIAVAAARVIEQILNFTPPERGAAKGCSSAAPNCSNALTGPPIKPNATLRDDANQTRCDTTRLDHRLAPGRESKHEAARKLTKARGACPN